MIKICKICKKEFKQKSGTSGKFCSYQCYWHSMKGKVVYVGGHTGKKHTAEYKKFMSELKTGKKMPGFSGDKHFAWKGDKVGYFALHAWVRKILGTPYKCENCSREDLRRRQYHWSNISGNYKRLISDWQRLCAKCHKAFDMSRV